MMKQPLFVYEVFFRSDLVHKTVLLGPVPQSGGHGFSKEKYHLVVPSLMLDLSTMTSEIDLEAVEQIIESLPFLT